MHTKACAVLAVFVLLFLSAESIVTDAGRAVVPPAQESERVLDIERYANEPLELVDFNVGVPSLKHKIKVKSRDPITKGGKDTVRFTGKSDWVKEVTIRLKNVSGRPIYGLAAAFHFQIPKQKMMFRTLLTRTRNLEQEPLQPSEEIELVVSDATLNRTKARMRRLGVEMDSLLASFSVDSALFSEDLMWYRGILMRRDPSEPLNWNAIDQMQASGANRGKQSNLFKRASFATVAANRPQTTCQQQRGGIQGFQCPGDIDLCLRIHEIGNGVPGLKSLHSSIGDCERQGVSCLMDALHDRLEDDSNCEVCPDADGDGFQAKSCGGSDCNDTPGEGASININASENCHDGIDNNCDDKTDEQDPCSCGGFEGPIFQAGGGIDCSLCSDGEDNDCDEERDVEEFSCEVYCWSSPVLVDVAGNGFALTNAANGVNFDLNGDGAAERLSWTVNQGDDAWLALDRNGNGSIDNGSELFGNFSPQPELPAGVARNGFNALALYDQRPQGGNTDGFINRQDAIFTKLLLWRDANHNGISEASELRTLQQLALTSIQCDYKESWRRDQYGNWFRYRAKVGDTRNSRLGRWAWDVGLLKG